MTAHSSLHLVLEAEQVASGLRTLEACGMSALVGYRIMVKSCSCVLALQSAENLKVHSFRSVRLLLDPGSGQDKTNNRSLCFLLLVICAEEGEKNHMLFIVVGSIYYF